MGVCVLMWGANLSLKGGLALCFGFRAGPKEGGLQTLFRNQFRGSRLMLWGVKEWQHTILGSK